MCYRIIVSGTGVVLQLLSLLHQTLLYDVVTFQKLAAALGGSPKYILIIQLITRRHMAYGLVNVGCCYGNKYFCISDECRAMENKMKPQEQPKCYWNHGKLVVPMDGR